MPDQETQLWLEQQRNSIRTINSLKKKWPFIQEKTEKTLQYFKLQITLYYLGLINSKNPDDPIARMVVPDTQELNIHSEELSDPTGDFTNCQELQNNPVPGIIHRYSDRALLMVTYLCSSYCRYCFRREIVSSGGGKISPSVLEEGIRYLQQHSEIQEVILTGGDPLTLMDHQLEYILKKLAQINHLRIIRIHTKFPVFNPYRITQELMKVLSSCSKPIWVIVHVCHPREITPLFRKYIQRFLQAGIPVLNQGVFLRQVNDQEETLRELGYQLAAAKIIPYAMHYPDKAKGTSHFRPGIQHAMNLWQSLRGSYSGTLIPELLLDLPRGYGKISLQKSFLSKEETFPGFTRFYIKSPVFPEKNIVYDEVM